MYYVVKPEPGIWTEININKKNITICRMKITGDEFDICIQNSKELDSKIWNESQYRTGLLNKAESNFDTEETGVLNEWAVCKLFGFIYNGNRVKGGFPYDLKINNNEYDVKGASKFRGKNYIKAIHEEGKKCILKSNFYFLSYINIEETNRDEKVATIDIVGVITKENIEKLEIVPSPTKSKHFNYEVCYDNPNIISIKRTYDRFCELRQSDELKQHIGKDIFNLL